MATQKEVLIDPIFNNNPIALQVLGICSALAVTINMATTLVMCLRNFRDDDVKSLGITVA